MSIELALAALGRRVLSIESGANDVVVLPVLLVLLAIAQRQIGSVLDWIIFLGKLLVIGPACGFIVGGAGAWLMSWVDGRTPVRREFQSLYGIGLVLTAYGVGAVVGVDGFLAAFAAGLGVTLLNQRLCDCFLDYGAATAEIAMLLAFGMFGALLSSLLGGALLVPSLALAAFTILAARPLSIGLVLLNARSLSWPARALIAWFGPRGLSSLLFALLSRPDPPLILDVRSRSQYAGDPRRIPGSIRVLPDEVEAWARGRSLQGKKVVTYCT